MKRTAALCRARSRAGTFATILTVLLLLGTGLGSAVEIAFETGSAAAADSADVKLTLAGQDAWTPLGAMFTLRLAITNLPSDATLRVVAYQNVTTRAELDRLNSGGAPSTVIDQTSVVVDSLPTEESGVRDLTLGLEAPNAPIDPVLLSLRYPGVYPLSVELRDHDDRVIGRFVTDVVVVDQRAGTTPVQRLGVAWVWPVTAAPVSVPGAHVASSVTKELRGTGRLGQQALALRNNPDVAVTLAPSPETLQAWFDAARQDSAVADTASALKGALGRGQTVSGSYVPIDVTSLLNAGMADAVDAEITQGNNVLGHLLDTPVDTRTALARSLDASALNHLHGDGADQVVVDSTALAPNPNDRSTIDRPFGITLPSGNSVSAVASDVGLSRLLTGDDPPALRAQRFLATLSLIANEDPTRARAVVVVNPDNVALPESMLEAVLSGLHNHPLLQPETLANVFSSVPADTTTSGLAVNRSLTAYTAPAAPVRASTYVSAQHQLDALRALSPTGSSVVTLAQRSLLAALSSAWNTPTATGSRSQLTAFAKTIRSFLDQIRVPNPDTITLTSHSGEIPLTFRNDTGAPVTVSIELSSPKLLFPGGASRVVTLAPKSTTVRFAVQTRSAGSFPLQLTVRSADGVLTLSDRPLRVQSTAATSIALVLMGGAGAFLALWWGFDIRRRRVRRRARPAA